MSKRKIIHFILILFIFFVLIISYLIKNEFPSYSLSRNHGENRLTYETEHLKINTNLFENKLNLYPKKIFLYDIYVKEKIYHSKEQIGQKIVYKYHIEDNFNILFSIYISNNHLPVKITHKNLDNKHYINNNICYQIQKKTNLITYEFEVNLQDSYAYGMILLANGSKIMENNNYDNLFIKNIEHLIEIN